jgi:hypothetical protein
LAVLGTFKEIVETASLDKGLMVDRNPLQISVFGFAFDVF